MYIIFCLLPKFNNQNFPMRIVKWRMAPWLSYTVVFQILSIKTVALDLELDYQKSIRATSRRWPRGKFTRGETQRTVCHKYPKHNDRFEADTRALCSTLQKVDLRDPWLIGLLFYIASHLLPIRVYRSSRRLTCSSRLMRCLLNRAENGIR